MNRIGLAASKMAKGDLFFYNVYVILIAFLFSLLIYFIAGSAIVLSLIIIGSIVSGLSSSLGEGWLTVIKICLISLSVVIGIITLFAISLNIKFIKSSSGRIRPKHKS